MVEDNSLDAELIERELRSAGYLIQHDVVSDPLGFAQRIRDHTYDVILCDYNLSGWTGLDALAELKRSGLGTPFILVSGSLGEDRAVECIKQGATDYVLKDRLSRLPLAIGRALEAREQEENQKRIAQELWASESKLGMVLNQLPAIVWTTDPELRMLSMAGAGLAHLERSKWGDLGRTLYEVLGTSDSHSPPIAAHLRALCGESAEYEIDEKNRSLAVRVEPLRNLEGKVIGCLGLALDVTKQKRSEEELRIQAREQSCVAEFGLFALRGGEIQELLDRAVRVVAEALDVEFSAVLELLEGGHELLLRAGAGWKPGLVGNARVGAGPESQAGYTLSINEPVVMPDLEAESRFRVSALVRDHGVTSGLTAPIVGRGGPFGVLGAHTARPRIFLREDALFIQAVANILATAIERERSSQELRQTNQTLQAMIASAPAAIVALDSSANVCIWNPAAARMFGQIAEEVLGKELPTVPESRREEYELLRDLLLQGGSIAGIETQQRRKDGSLIDVILSAASVGSPSVRYPPPVHAAVIAVLTDISERKRAEAEKLRLSTAIEQSAECILISDIHGVIQYVNPAFCAVTGYSREEAVGNRSNILHSGKHHHAFYENLWKTILGGQSWRGEFQNRKKDGAIVPMEAVITPVREAGGQITSFICFHTDVTERRNLDRQLLQSQKFEAVGQLAGGIAHDFNNVLAAILGMAELGLLEAPEGTRIRERLEKIRHHGGRAVALTKQLLAFSRRQVLERRDMNLNHCVAEVASLLGESLGKDIELRTNLAPDLEATRADPAQVEQVLMNLCVNARDAMPGGGQLSIHTRNVHADEEFCRSQPGARPGDYVCLSVSDTGMGMNAATMERIFEPFFTTKPPGQGTGLGLATVYGIVKQHNGFVHVYSELGEGATFRIYFPTAAATEAECPPALSEMPTSGGRETILLADDQTALCELERESLEALGYTVLSAQDGEEAVETFRQYNDKVDLLILDVVMPRLRGPDAYRRISALRPGVPVIFCTGYDPASATVTAISGHPVLQKPFSTRDLARAVRTLLDARQPIRN
jgi:PAS domain S-box-containing protein